jgi:hypothetical protein
VWSVGLGPWTCYDADQAGYREICLYVDGSTDTAERLLAWTRGCGWPARLSVEEDPEWWRRS